MNRRFRDVPNQETIDLWVRERLSLISSSPAKTLLDVGAGQKRYRDLIENLGFLYTSHDFNSYKPNTNSFGFQEKSWPAQSHDYICDILDITEDRLFQIILCTEVLEHVPDPVSALHKLKNLTLPGGHIIVTVPFMSLAHQSPFWFSSGLSHFWFEYWSAKLNLEVLDLTISGDFVDHYKQIRQIVEDNVEITKRSFFPKRKKNIDLSKLRHALPHNVLSAGGFGVFAHLHRANN